jgi:putative membrane protein insertion efficiency factor
MKKLFLILIRLYRLCLSPFLGQCCRFYPSCSVYAEEAIQKYGILKGSYLTLKRLCKCAPWHPGGYDPP